MEILQVQRLDHRGGVVLGHLLDEEDLHPGVAHRDDVLVEVGGGDVELLVVDDVVPDVLHRRSLRVPLGDRGRLVGDQ